MGRGDALEEDPGGSRVDVGVDPFGPSGKAFGEGDQSVHVLVEGGPFLDEVPSAQ